jgi:hypothetical protein
MTYFQIKVSYTSSEYGSDHEWTGADAPNPDPDPGPLTDPDPGPSTDPDPDFDWDRWMSLDDPPPQVGHVQQPNPTVLDPEFDWDHWMSLHDPLAPPLRPASPNQIGLAPEHQVGHVQQPNPGPSSSAPQGPDHESTNVVQTPAPNPASSTANPGSLMEPSSSTAQMQGSWDHFNALWDNLWWYKPGANPRPVTPPSPDPGSPKEPENEVVPGPPPTPESTDPELYSDPQSLSAGIQPEDLRAAMYGDEDLQDAIYAEKGKAKESRSISGVGNVAQRELQPAVEDGTCQDPGTGSLRSTNGVKVKSRFGNSASSHLVGRTAW